MLDVASVADVGLFLSHSGGTFMSKSIFVKILVLIFSLNWAHKGSALSFIT